MPSCKTFKSFKNAKIDLHSWLNDGNVSISVWEYREIEDKYTADGRFIRKGPKYSSAITDKLFFDIDCLHGNKFDSKAHRSMFKLWDWCDKKDFKREVSFTGGGYHFLIDMYGTPETYSSVMEYVIKDLDLTVDENYSLRDMRRLVGSINFGKDGKSERNNFCISLNEDEIKLPFNEHRRLSKEFRSDRYIYGREKFSPPKKAKKYNKQRTFKVDPNFELDSKIEDVLYFYGYEYQDLCQYMRNVIEQPSVGHNERLYLLSYFKNVINVKYSDMIVLFPKLLDGKHGYETDGGHSISEGQIKHVYSNNKGFSVDLMRRKGYCDPECNYCTDMMEIGKFI